MLKCPLHERALEMKCCHWKAIIYEKLP